ncbi:MAG: UDP-3-O-acyl-N-acetylglucosamine deacetylase [Planctomycetota bacterium]
MRKQRTIGRPATLEGSGIHFGKEVQLHLKPADANTGIVFIRTDLPGAPRVPARLEFARREARRTVLKRGEAEVYTVEHLLAAANVIGVDNLEVEMTANEPPGLDGSSKEYAKILSDAGIVELDATRREYTVEQTISVTEGGATIVAMPSETRGLTISYTLNYTNNTPIPSQHLTLHVTEKTFNEGISDARTFVLDKEAERLRKAGYGKGATYDNTLVIGDDGHVLNNTLRYEDEFVRHKILDLLGDLTLTEFSLNSHIIAIRSGHQLNIRMVEQLVEAEQEKERRKQKILLGPTTMDIRQIQKILPHRYPFLLVDRIVALEGDSKVVGIKNVTINEPFFPGHFPDQPVMPAVMQIEAMAQVAGALLLTKTENLNKLAFILSVDEAKFRKVVTPGDQLVLEAKPIRIRSRVAAVETRTLVGGEVVSEAKIKFMLVDSS